MKLIKAILENHKVLNKQVQQEQVKEDFTVETGDMNTFLQAIDKLPETIEYVKVPVNTKKFKTSNDYAIMVPKPGFKEEVKSIISGVVRDYKAQGEEVQTYYIKNPFGRYDKNPEKGKYIVDLETEQSAEFARQMGAGKHGSLD